MQGSLVGSAATRASARLASLALIAAAGGGGRNRAGRPRRGHRCRATRSAAERCADSRGDSTAPTGASRVAAEQRPAKESPAFFKSGAGIRCWPSWLRAWATPCTPPPTIASIHRARTRRRDDETPHANPSGAAACARGFSRRRSARRRRPAPSKERSSINRMPSFRAQRSRRPVRGDVTTVTDQEGIYRFVGLQPATYTVRTELSGFVTQESQADVGMGRTVTVDFALKLTTLSEKVEVRASASAVDVRSSATETTVSSDLLNLMPIYSATSTGLLNNAPGINSSSAYGAQGSYGNALLMDGVDTRDPEGGSAWTFFNQNLIQEIQIGGLGAPAEYGGFTGAIINTVTKSGTNAFSGLFSLRYTNDSLASDNVSQDYLDREPDAWRRRDRHQARRLHRPGRRTAEARQGVLLRQRPAVFGEPEPGGTGDQADGYQSALQHEVHAPADGDRHVDPRNAVRHLQPDRPRRVLARVAGGRQPDGDRGRPGVGVERAVPQDLRQQQPARSEVYRLLGLLLSRPGRSVDLHIRWRER